MADDPSEWLALNTAIRILAATEVMLGNVKYFVERSLDGESLLKWQTFLESIDSAQAALCKTYGLEDIETVGQRARDDYDAALIARHRVRYCSARLARSQCPP